MEIIILILIIAIIAIQIYTKVNDKTKLTKTLENISFMINNPEATIKEKIMYCLNFKYKNQILKYFSYALIILTIILILKYIHII